MNILITGGTRGIGRACVERFASDGHRVAFLYRSRDDLAAGLEKETGAVAIRADLSDPSAAVSAAEQAQALLGDIDVLVDADWKQMLDTNLSGAFYITRTVLSCMIRKKSGRIIQIGSMWGKVGASCEVHYSAAKAALRGMTLALAKEVGPSGITVNCIEPGVILTDMNRELDAATMKSLCDETPLGRCGTPEEVAALAAFLASDEAGFITGQTIGIDGGYAI